MSDIFFPIQKELDIVEEKIAKICRTSLPLADQAISYVFNSRGKRLRPALLLFAAQNEGRIAENILETAAYIEVVHISSLLHDDVMDEADLRRGKPSLNKKFGNKISVILPDLFLAQIFKKLSEREDSVSLNHFTLTMKKMAIGQLREIQNSNNFEMSEKEYLTLISEKTASLFSTSCLLGAKLSGKKEEAVTLFEKFGENLGMAFQIIDDYLDFWGNRKEIGKPVMHDINNGYYTLPVLHILHNATAQDRLGLINYLKNPKESSTNGSYLKSLLKNYSSEEYILKRAFNYAENAKKEIPPFLDNDIKNSLCRLVDYVIERRK